LAQAFTEILTIKVAAMIHKSRQVFAVWLLWLRVASSKDCSQGVCTADKSRQFGAFDDDLDIGQSNDLSLVQVSAMEKRAQEAAASATAQSLDASVKRKGGSAETPVDQASTKKSSKDKPSKGDSAFTDKASAKKVSTKETSEYSASSKKASEDKASTKKASKDKVSKTTNKANDPWILMGDGCCEGKREPSNGKLFGLNVSTIDECKAKCRTFNNCGMVEYGWKDMPQWCYGWGDSQKCEKRDANCVESVPGNGKGVQGYRFTAPKIDVRAAAAQYKWEEIGPGCCDGKREEGNGKLYANKEATLDACKARCLSFDNCGIVEYGWTSGDPEWCYIWDNSQKCKQLDLTCKQSAMGNGFGAKAHRLSK